MFPGVQEKGKATINELCAGALNRTSRPVRILISSSIECVAGRPDLCSLSLPDGTRVSWIKDTIMKKEFRIGSCYSVDWVT